VTELLLQRDRLTAKDCTGQLYLMPERRWLCYILEDQVRLSEPKVYGKTAIPAGRYRISITRSPRFGRDMPLLHDVPGFSGIRIHAGNSAQDTEGCLLPGLARSIAADGTQRVTQSRDAYQRLMLTIQRGLAISEQCWITIKDAGK